MCRDHPRSRGVYFSYDPSDSRTVGSSPLARGLRIPYSNPTSHAGIIPARAGFTARHWHLFSAPRDHPRSRGVYPFPCFRKPCRDGSSPLARGLHFFLVVCTEGNGIIPARAGFTEHLADSVLCGRGSSPLARGLPLPSFHERKASGIIPARAGFTAITLTSLLGYRDHPRSRGVYPPRLAGTLPVVGSSPLARGLRVCSRYYRVRTGIIPARAGFTVGKDRDHR